MKYCIHIILLLFVIAGHSFAQNTAISVTYHYDYVTDSTLIKKKQRFSDRMVLNIQGQKSEFYSLLYENRRVLQDSMLAKGYSVAEIQNERAKLPKSNLYPRIYKNYPGNGKLTSTDEVGLSYFKYTEDQATLMWNMQNETKEILGYKCQKATAQFRGRKWEAWYTAEIAVHEGPWKLWGLPGLILEAQDEDNLFHFTAIGLKKEERNKPISELKNQYITCTRQELYRNKVKSSEDPLGYMEASSGGTMKLKALDPQGKDITNQKISKVYVDIEADF